MTRDRDHERTLLEAIDARREELARLLDRFSSHWEFEDPVYRFYHQSFKVFALQQETEQIVAALQRLAPGRALHPIFVDIVRAATGLAFNQEDNHDWPRKTRPILEAFFHARFFLEMAVRYARTEAPPPTLPSGYAALLYLYGLR